MCQYLEKSSPTSSFFGRLNTRDGNFDQNQGSGSVRFGGAMSSSWVRFDKISKEGFEFGSVRLKSLEGFGSVRLKIPEGSVRFGV